MSTARIPFADYPPSRQAGILCNDERFQRLAATRCGLPGQQFSSSAAAEYLRACCKVASRRLLDTDPTARARFDALRTEFDAWVGRIARPR